MKILIVEDDYLQAEWLQGILAQSYPHATIKQIQTELEFRNAAEGLRKHPPDIVLLDVMLRWTDPSPKMIAAPADVRESRFYRAGLRCERILRKHPETENVPVILYTVLEENDLRQDDFGVDLQNLHANTFYINKDADPTELLEVIKRSAEG